MDKPTGFKTQPKTPEIASANRRVKPLARLLLCATALRVNSACPLRLGVYYGRKVPFRPVHTARNSRDRTAQSRPARPLVSPFPPQGSPLTRPAKSGVF